MKVCAVYILTNKSNTVLYTGVTSDLEKRLHDHITNMAPGSFTSRYRVRKLVYYEEYEQINDAILREKQIKGGSRRRKLQLIDSLNPDWKDLTDDFLGTDGGK